MVASMTAPGLSEPAGSLEFTMTSVVRVVGEVLSKVA